MLKPLQTSVSNREAASAEAIFQSRSASVRCFSSWVVLAAIAIKTSGSQNAKTGIRPSKKTAINEPLIFTSVGIFMPHHLGRGTQFHKFESILTEDSTAETLP